MRSPLLVYLLGVSLLVGFAADLSSADDIVSDSVNLDVDLGLSREGSRTDAEAVQREGEAIKLDGLNAAQIKELRENAEKFTFQAEIYLRELISNASDALDKIRLLSLTDPSSLSTTNELSIKIKTDKENRALHITDTGIGMTKQDLVNNLGTIAKSGTAEFLSKMQDSAEKQDMNDMIGQFGVGFYSSFLVADRVVVTTKHNDDEQYIWESDASSFSITKDPRGNTLKRGTQISLYMKEEASDYLEQDTIRNLVKRYSQFINFPIYLWSSKTEKVEEPVEESEEPKKASDDDEAQVEDDKTEEAKTKTVEKTVWDWEILNDSKPIWTRKPADITDEEYNEFYKALTKDSSKPLAKVHFVAEGEVTFKSLLYVPSVLPSESFNRYGTKSDNVKLYVRRVFITDEFAEMLPNYLSFIQGVIDSDDLPLNVSRETLQQHKLLKVIKKKLVRKALDMMKKMDKPSYKKFWKEYSTNIKLGVVEDAANRSRLAKLLMFHSSNQSEMTSLEEYVTRMKPKQTHIYYLAGANREEVEQSPFVERLRKKGYEVLYLVEAVDEYCITALPEFEGKKFQNVAKEGFSLSEADKDRHEAAVKAFEPLTKWLSDEALKDQIAKAAVSERLTDSPCALVASMFGWTGNMERLAVSNAHQKADDPNRAYHLNQRKTLEINPRHPLIKNLLQRIEVNSQDPVAKEMAVMMFRTATLRSGYLLKDTAEFAASVEQMMRQTLGIPIDEPIEEEEEVEEDASNKDDDKPEEDEQDHDEL
ncbi:Endoplasmin [Frankliniella fusca]|uniref:Heat shock protein 83 n=1 Tax=Frankliniella fusca TaxID=407009 RepID=A0AAE1HXM6_9NEOP|nr:Endoplasmin [Frankliniella fusca]